ncbi:MAG: VOC family protein [Chitinophagaceae bacterium]|nr:MAG: VOC family protein [Chitinophagaceae bacterium]
MKNNLINYVEFKAGNLDEIKDFYSQTFGWKFTDYGPTYVAFSESGLEGGFEKTDKEITQGALVVLYHEDLESIQKKIVQFGGKISIDTFSFPGGKRFHFIDPAGNELAIWSDR